jgi:threonine dehydratase
MNQADIDRARSRLRGHLVRTPCERSAVLSSISGAELYLKLENLQFTASFKERGALNCLLQLSAAERERGVIAMSAGNHAQALAYHCRRLGVPACIVMPRITPNAKVAQTRVHDAEVILHGNLFDETLAFTQALAGERGLTLVHPFDDERVMAGQGTIGLEVVEQVPDLEIVVVPIGGGGLIAGTATAVKALRPEVAVIGVQVEGYAAAYNGFHGIDAVTGTAFTVAEGIAVKAPGERTLPVIRALVDDVVLVSEAQVEQAVFALLEIEKTVVEGAGAASLAAVLAQPARFAGHRTALVVSGGNIDMMILSSVVQRGLVRSRRLVRLQVEIPDQPGALGDLARLLGELDSNIVEIAHQRTFGASSVRATMVELVLQMRGEEQVEQVLSALADSGYEARLLER